MATLKHLRTGADVPLAARHVVGRSRTCRLRIDLPSTSALHAELTWDGRAWSLRDLGSRNGTFVDGRKVSTGIATVVEVGMEIGFGTREAQYRFADGRAPSLIAFGADGEHVAESDVLCLPSTRQCDAIVFQAADGHWVIERAEGTETIADEECVVVGNAAFHVHLPGVVPVTRELDGAPTEAPSDDGILELRVSRDGEHVDLAFHVADRTHHIEPRAHGFLLLSLARARAADAARDDLPDSEHGWMHREELLRELALDDPQLLNLWVHRARQQFAAVGLRSAARIVERREGAGQLRLGISRIRIADA
jgi:FHA domain